MGNADFLEYFYLLFQVVIGGIEFNPGYLKYRTGYWNDEFTKYLIVGGALGGAAFIVTVVSVWISVSTTKFMKSEGKDSYNNSLVGDYTSDDAESIVPNPGPMEGYTNEEMPKFNSARFYTSASRGRGYDNPVVGPTTNTDPSMGRTSMNPSIGRVSHSNRSMGNNSQLFMY